MICPNCQNDVEVLEKNFGALFTCPKCQAVYFINFEGTPEFSSAPIDYHPEQYNQPEPEPEVESAAEPELTPEADARLFAEPIETEFPGDGQIDAALGTGFSLDPMDIAAVETPAQNSTGSFSSIAQEISDFGNTEVQIAALNYDLEIGGLDSKDEVKKLEEALTDSRFGWDVADVMKTMSRGKLTLEKLNPVQAYVIIKRIHFLGLDMKWTQNVLE